VGRDFFHPWLNCHQNHQRDIHSEFIINYLGNAFAGIQIRSQSDPVVQHNKIHHGLESGIHVVGVDLCMLVSNCIIKADLHYTTFATCLHATMQPAYNLSYTV
jgi:hypothetical protein